MARSIIHHSGGLHNIWDGLVLRGYSDGGWIMENEGNRSQSLLDWLTSDEEAAVLRSDTRYKVLAERLRNVARKPK